MELFQSMVVSRVNDAWELKSNVDRLRDSLPRANHLMEKAEWWRFKDRNIACLLKRLRDAAYDAEDVIAMYDYCQLKQQIEGQSKHQVLSSVTTFIEDLINNYPSKVKDAQARLDSSCSNLDSVIRPLGIPDGPNPYGKAIQQETSSFLPELVLGRDDEVEKVVKLMLQLGDRVGSSSESSNSSLGNTKKRRKIGNLSILPIVGMGGIGKTTLAQLIYNDERVKNHFDLRIWVCVSDHFDLKKITKEMIQSAKRHLEAKGNLRNDEKQIGFGESTSNLDSFQQILKDMVASRKYLIVLDDVWHEKARDWETLCNPLRFGLQGSMILITTRMPMVAEMAGTLDPINVEALPSDSYWDLFKQCAFGSSDPSSIPELEAIGKKIATRLKGSPLAAKTLGGILHANMTIDKWRNILNSELWQIEQTEGDILPALQVSYQYLPVHLKRCFQTFSLFPKDHDLFPEQLVPLWVSDGIINQEYRKGDDYFQDFVNRSFFVTSNYHNKSLHDLMHDLSKSLSEGIFYCLECENRISENHNNVRHLSVFYGDIIEWTDKEIGRCKNLRSLMFRSGTRLYEMDKISSNLASLFNQLTYLRFLNLNGFNIEELPESIGNLKLLICINLGNTNIKSLPDSMCHLYNLQVVNVEECPLQSFPKLFHNLINLRFITRWTEIGTKIPSIGKLTSLETLGKFRVLKEDGHKIEELKNLTQLRGELQISNLENVESREDAARACLHNKEHVRSLTLSWSPISNTGSRNRGIDIDQNIIEGLQPHPNLKGLNIENYEGRAPPSWFQKEKLPFLKEFSLEGFLNLESLEEWFMSHQLSSLSYFKIKECAKLVSFPLKLINSSSITALEIEKCPLLMYPNNSMLPPNLGTLQLDSCGQFDTSLPGCLQNLSLSYLGLCNCHHVTSLPSQVTHHITYLILRNCAELQCLELSNPSILRSLEITKCPMLIQSGTLSSDHEAPLERIRELNSLKIDNTSLLKLPFLRNPPRSIIRMSISNSPEESLFTGEIQGWLSGLENLKFLEIKSCCNLESLPEELHTLVTLRYMELTNCPKIQSLPRNGLPPTLYVYFSGCHPALTEQLEQRAKRQFKSGK